MTGKDDTQHAVDTAKTVKNIEDFLFWYMDSYDDFCNRGRFGGGTPTREEVQTIKKSLIMQVCVLA